MTCSSIIVKSGLLALTSRPNLEPDFQRLLAAFQTPPTPHFQAELRSARLPGFTFLLMSWAFSQLLRGETESSGSPLSHIQQRTKSYYFCLSLLLCQSFSIFFLLYCLSWRRHSIKIHLIWIFFLIYLQFMVHTEQSFNLCTPGSYIFF